MKSAISGPLFKWFGSKWLSSRLLPKPKFGIVEPFAGGAGYSLRYSDKQVTIWDDDPNLQVLWAWLIGEATEPTIREIPIDVPEGTDIRSLGLSTGQAMLMKHWQRTNNVGDCWTVSPWGNKPGQWTANTRARVASEVGAIKHWRFQRPNWEAESTTFFIDPPYLYNYRYRSSHVDFLFDTLASYVHAIPKTSQVIVCEAVCSKTNRVPNYLPFAFFGERVTSRRKATENHHSKELIYTRNCD